MTRALLRVYLGAAPGVGKTYAMLGEGHRRRQRATDVVIGFLEPHGRPMTMAEVGDLEVVPRRTTEVEGMVVEEMDVDAVLRRRPEVVLIDELAHTNAPGSRHAKRWQDVEELLASGISVVTTLNIQHLESLSDVVERITGIAQHEKVPDAVVRAADQIELVDMSPEALRRRMAHGNIRRKRSTSRWPTTFGSAIWRRCANWRCCGSRTGSMRASSCTGSATASSDPGRPRNGWWWRSASALA